jgi:hypothetical protein
MSVDVSGILDILFLSALWGAVCASHFWDVHGRRDVFAEWGDFKSWKPVECGSQVNGHVLSELGVDI